MKVYICYYTNYSEGSFVRMSEITDVFSNEQDAIDYVNDSNSKADTDDIEYDYEERDVIE